MSTTIIRHRKTEKGFDVVVTSYENREIGFVARYQSYIELDSGGLYLDQSLPYGDEQGAIALFNETRYGDQITSINSTGDK